MNEIIKYNDGEIESKLSIENLDDAKKVDNIGVYSDDFAELLLKEKGFSNLD